MPIAKFDSVTVNGIRYKYVSGRWSKESKKPGEKDIPDDMPIDWLHDPEMYPGGHPRPLQYDHLYFLRKQGVNITWSENDSLDIGPLTPLGPPSETSQRVRRGLPVRCPTGVYNPNTKEFSRDIGETPQWFLEGALAGGEMSIRICKNWEEKREEARKRRKAWGYFEELNVGDLHDPRILQQVCQDVLKVQQKAWQDVEKIQRQAQQEVEKIQQQAQEEVDKIEQQVDQSTERIKQRALQNIQKRKQQDLGKQTGRNMTRSKH